MVELWARNPSNYIRECVRADQRLLIWDRGILKRLQIDPQQHGRTWYPPDRPFRALAVGDQGAVEVDREHGWYNPVAVYPVWEYGQHSMAELEDWITSNPAADPIALLKHNAGRPVDECWVPGQEHRVVIIRTPRVDTGIGKRFMALVSEMQLENPHCIVHIHGLYSYGWVFGAGFRSGDLDLRIDAAKGKIRLPTGRKLLWEAGNKQRRWFHLLGFHVEDMAVPANRCVFNIRAAQYAARNWDRLDDISTAQELTDADVEQLVNGRAPKPLPLASSTARRDQSLGVLPGDKFFCDACSYARTCRSYREGSICTVPDSDSNELAAYFRTRNSSKIIEGLGRIIEEQASRYKEGRASENLSDDGLDPHVTKILDGIFAKGVTLAKLVDPTLRTAAVAVNVAAGSASVSVGQNENTPNALAAKAVGELEAAGIPRRAITSTMLQRCLQGQTSQVVAEEAPKWASGVLDLPSEEADDVGG